MLEHLRHEVHQAILQLAAAGLLDSFHGGVSAIDRKRGLVIVRPRTVDYLGLTDDDYLVMSARYGHVVEGTGEPPQDLALHLALYEAFPGIGSVTGCFSKYATTWAQAGYAIPCLGYFHADHFSGDIPLVDFSASGEDEDLFAAGGRAIGRFFGQLPEEPLLVGGALLARVGPFTWADSASHAARRAVALEKAAEMAFATFILNGESQPVDPASFGLSAGKALPKSVATPLKPRIRGMPDIASGRKGD